MESVNEGYSTNNVNSFETNMNSGLGRQANTFSLPRPAAVSQSSISQLNSNQQGVILTNINNEMNNLNDVNLPLYIQPNDTIHNEINLQPHQSDQRPEQSKIDPNRSSASNMPQQQAYKTGDSSFLDNFNTLVTVAAAQTPSISPNSEIHRSRKNNFIKVTAFLFYHKLRTSLSNFF